MDVMDTLLLLYVLLAGGGCWFLRHLYLSGMFQCTVSVDTMPFPKTKIVYKNYVGPYKNVGGHFEKLLKDIQQVNEKANQFVGIYYDNPETVPEDKCRSTVAVVCNREASEGIGAGKLVKMGYSTAELKETSSFHSTFPFYGLVSILLGLYRVYPAVQGAAKEHGKDVTVMIECTRMREHINDYFGAYGPGTDQFFALVEDRVSKKSN